MITSIIVRNIGSIEKAELSFEKAGYKYLEEYVLCNRVANPVAVYGANGSGKSAILNVFYSLVNLLIEEPDKINGFIPNLFTKNTPYSIEVHFTLDNMQYMYSISENQEGICNEELHINGSATLVRTQEMYSYEKKKYRIEASSYPALRDVISKGIANDNVTKSYEFLSNIAFVGASRRDYYVKAFRNKPYLDVLVEKSCEVKNILKNYKEFPLYEITSSIRTGEKKRYSALFEMGSSNFSLPIEFLSDGMQNQSFLLSILLSLPENGVLVIDEIDSALHPLTISDFIETAVFRNIQLIFSGHNTNVLSHLRPDNIFFAHWKDGKSSYKRLCDIYPNIREVNNIEKMYLASTFDEGIKG